MSFINKIFALCLLAACTQITGGQQRGTHQTAGAKPLHSIETVYSDKPFDASIVALSSHFRGNNAAQIYQLLAKREQALTKREFETTDAHRLRADAEPFKILSGSITQQSTIAFVVNNLEAEYDADQQILAVKAPLDGGILIWNVATFDTGSYVGTNAFGVRAKVESHETNSYQIAIPNYQQFSTLRYFDKAAQESKKVYEERKLRISDEVWELDKHTAFAADFRMDASRAMKAKENLRLLLICRPTSPYTTKSETYSAPTIDYPQSTWTRDYRLNTELLEVWFFDSSTGEVYAKQKRQAPPPTASTESSKQTRLKLADDVDTNRIYKANEVSQKARITYKPEPAYTITARHNQVTDTVVLRVVLEATGKIGSVEMVSGLPFGLSERAIEAARKIKLTPAIKAGQPVSESLVISYPFNLD
jgi:hypothetical protein